MDSEKGGESIPVPEGKRKRKAACEVRRKRGGSGGEARRKRRGSEEEARERISNERNKKKKQYGEICFLERGKNLS